MAQHPLSIGVNGCIPNKSFLRRFRLSPMLVVVVFRCRIIIPFHFDWIPPFVPDNGRWMLTALADCACGRGAVAAAYGSCVLW